MTRKVLALLVVVIATGLAPATAILGFCAQMPCCFAEVGTGPALAVDMADCCSPIACYEAPPHELAASGKAKAFPATNLATLPVTAAMPQASAARQRTFDDTSPPLTTNERLSSLSVFLI